MHPLPSPARFRQKIETLNSCWNELIVQIADEAFEVGSFAEILRRLLFPFSSRKQAIFLGGVLAKEVEAESGWLPSGLARAITLDIAERYVQDRPRSKEIVAEFWCRELASLTACIKQINTNICYAGSPLWGDIEQVKSYLLASNRISHATFAGFASFIENAVGIMLQLSAQAEAHNTGDKPSARSKKAQEDTTVTETQLALTLPA